MMSIASSLFGQLTDSVSRSRNVTLPVLRQIIDRAPLTAEQAVESRLTDGTLYREGVYAAVRDLVSPFLHKQASELSGQQTRLSTLATFVYNLGGILATLESFLMLLLLLLLPILVASTCPLDTLDNLASRNAVLNLLIFC